MTIGDPTMGGGNPPSPGAGGEQTPTPSPPTPSPPTPSPPTRYPWPAYFEELRQAAARKNASFPQTFMAMYIAENPWVDRATRDGVAELYPGLLECFEQAYGNIIDSRYGNAAAAGAVLLARADEQVGEAAQEREREKPGTAKGGLAALRERLSAAAVDPGGPRTPRASDLDAFVWWQFLHFDSQDATELLADVLSLRDRITTFLPGFTQPDEDARDIALRRLYGIGRELIESIDGEEQRSQAEIMAQFTEAHASVKTRDARVQIGMPLPQELWPEFQNFDAQHKDQRPSTRFVRGVASLRARLSKDESVYLASVQRLAQREYLNGMFRGFAALLVPIVILAIATGVIGFDAGWLAVAVGGAMGAVLSVLQRMGRGLDLGPEGERRAFKQQGLFRPVIGAVLGIASFVLLKGGLVSLSTPPGNANQVLYYGGIAFLAGFSERFAQDMLVPPARAGGSGGDASQAGKPS
jgi:hypothetical protein